jgi:CheY-like chemotaxis protein
VRSSLKWYVGTTDLGSQGFNGNQLQDHQSHRSANEDLSRGDSLERRPLQVLVVDDDHDTCAGLALLVKLWGHAVRVAHGGRAAVHMAAEQQPDVLLLDLGMPEMDGFEVARQLRRELSSEECFLIAISGWSDGAHRRKCVEVGIDLFLIKPVDAAVVETLLMLEAARLNRCNAGDRRPVPAIATAAW